jgi:hypothetical protein
MKLFHTGGKPLTTEAQAGRMVQPSIVGSVENESK